MRLSQQERHARILDMLRRDGIVRIATLARTQKAAFLGGMCYLMTVSMVLLICSMNGIPVLPYLAIEYHGPRILHAAITGEVYPHHWRQLLGALALAAAWLAAAGWLFRRRGWQ